MTTADTTTPTISPICCFLGVAPTRKPVFRVLGGVASDSGAMAQMMPPMTMAAIMPWMPSFPVAFSSKGGNQQSGVSHAGHRVIGGTDQAHHP